MKKNKKPIDAITVRDYINNDYQPNNRSWAVDFQDLATLTEGSKSTKNIETYATHIRECRIKNEIESWKKDIAYDNYQETVSEIQNLQLELEDKDESSVKAIVGKTVDYLENLTFGSVGLSSGFKSLDALITGFRPETLTVLAGRPSMGKSTLALNIADEVSKTKNVIFYSLEMGQVQLMLKMASSHSSINLSKIDNGNMSDTEEGVFYKELADIGNQNLTIIDKGGMSINDIVSKSRQLNSEKKVDMIVIDYLQIMKYDKGREISELGNITRELKYLSKELGIPIILLSQLSRNVEQRENKRPFMSDLRSSGEIEQDADIIIMVYRDEYYDPDSEDKGLAELIVSKNRMGQIGFVKCEFHGQYSKFKDMEVNIYDR
tara:strand:+ start:70 stop:1200 length:1131 start_codon:yes stop_codon:yes gene_type:complete